MKPSKPRPPRPAPVRTAHDAPFWEGTSKGELSIKRCASCERPHWYPRRRCPFCGSDRTEWESVSGRGTVYSFAIDSRSRRPRAAAIVELEEGPRMSTVVSDCDVHQLAIDDEVRVGFRPNPGDETVQLPYFTTLTADAARAYSAESLEASRSTPGVDLSLARPVTEVGVVGAGTMGIGITKALLAGGATVTLVDPDEGARSRARTETIAYLDRLELPHDRVRVGSSTAELSEAGLVIEAVYEQLSLKRSVLAELAQVTRPDCILATNTSSLDLDDLAAASGQADRVLGLHFFSPAHVMRLVEVVRGQETSPEALATALELMREVGKTPVVVGVCPGFVGNRLMFARNRQSQTLLLEGALPEQIDRVMREFGLPMGPYEMLDLGGGIELSVRRREETGEENWLVDELYRRGRRGQRTGRGYYQYREGDRTPRPDPEVAEVVVAASVREGIERRDITDQEIADRLVLPMINEAARIVDEGMVTRPSDVDVVWRDGFGWPTWKGGPLYYADRIGTKALVQRLAELAEQHGDDFTPAPLLVRLAETDTPILDHTQPDDSSEGATTP